MGVWFQTGSELRLPESMDRGYHHYLYTFQDQTWQLTYLPGLVEYIWHS